MSIKAPPPFDIEGLGPSHFFEGSPIATFVIDASHVVTHYNQACAALLGVPAEQVIGRRGLGPIFYGVERPVMADLIVDGAMADILADFYQNTYRSSLIIPEAYEAEGFFPHLGPSGRWLFFTAAPLKDRQGRVVGAIETLQDITERKLAEAALMHAQLEIEAIVHQRSEQLVTAQEHLMQSEKLASIGQLAAGVAHEINNPIGYIFSNYGMLESYLDSLFQMLDAYEQAEGQYRDPAVAQQLRDRRQTLEVDFLKQDIPDLMRESKEGIVRVRKIVQDLKDFTHVDAHPQWSFANLNQGIDSTLNVVNNEVKYRADIVKEYGELPLVQCLPSEINQVVMNLVVNAAHAIGPERGRICIRTGVQDNAAFIEVCDNGSGIPKDVLPRIFDPFYTTKPVGKGTGLGLSLSYGIMQKHHGSIEVQTEPGQGSTFRLRLPLLQSSQASAP